MKIIHPIVALAKLPAPWARAFLVSSATALLCGLIYYVGWFAYPRWSSGCAAKEARMLLQKHDVQGAAISARHGLQIDPGNIECCKVLADIAESRGDRAAIYVRLKIVDLQPESLEAILECAGTALALGQPKAADEVLRRVADAQCNDPKYHALRGQTAGLLGQMDLAVNEYSKAFKLEPQNEQHQLDYAAALLKRAWLEDRIVARAILVTLRTVPSLRSAALRALLQDSIANEESKDAVGLARELAAEPQAAFSDKIVLLDLLNRAHSAEFPDFFDTLKASARGISPQMAELVTWMSRNDRAGEALEWGDSFSADEWSDPRVCLAMAASALVTEDWTRLESFSSGGNWQDLDYLRCALLARALREEGKNLESKRQWRVAIGMVAKLPHASAQLARLIANWRWEDEFEDLLRVTLEDPKEAVWASQMLCQIRAKKKDTEGLRQATADLVKADPENDAAANDYALSSLLLGKNVPQVSRLAQKLYTKHRTEASYVSTYAYSLYLQDQLEEALHVMQSLGQEALEQPDLAAYYGAFLAANGENERAEKFLSLAQGADLFPEERELLNRAGHAPTFRSQAAHALSGVQPKVPQFVPR